AASAAARPLLARGRCTMMIEVEGLDVTFGDHESRLHAVRNVSFRVAEGESFGLVGESGSGKSTVLRALSGLNPRWSGRIRVAGPPRGRRRPRAFHKLSKMVSQAPYAPLPPPHTVDRILPEPIAIHRLGNADRRIESALIEVGLEPAFRFRYPH